MAEVFNPRKSNRRPSGILGTLPGKAELMPPITDDMLEKKWIRYFGKEDNFQRSAAKFLDSLKVLWSHVANERSTKTRQSKKGVWYSPEGSKMKLAGVKRGFPDIMIYEPRLDYHGFFAELKVWPNKATTEQQAWHFSLLTRGWRGGVYYSLDKLIHDINEYLGKK